MPAYEYPYYCAIIFIFGARFACPHIAGDIPGFIPDAATGHQYPVAYGSPHPDVGLSTFNGKEIDKVPSGLASKLVPLKLTSTISEI